MPKHLSIVDRFWQKVDKTDTCWLWSASLMTTGYGQFVVYKNHHIGAHRFAYELMVGPIPDGLQIDHLCRVRTCVNPAHLEPVTRGENMHRGIAIQRIKEEAAARTHCKRGHEYTPETSFRRERDNARICRSCLTITRKAREQNQRAA